MSLWWPPEHFSRCRIVPFREEKTRRIFEAFKQNIDGWAEAVAEIESIAVPENRIRCLHLLKSLEQAKAVLIHLIEDASKD